MKLRAGDQVVVISGKDKGKTGSILKVLPPNRAVVSDVNMRTKHVKSQPNRPGQIVKYEASIHISNIMLVDPKTKKRSRIGFNVEEKGKARIAKRSGQPLVAVKTKDVEKAEVKQEKKAPKKTEKKETKDAKKEAPKAAEKVEAPKKSPFWKRMGFGSEAIEESASDQKQTQDRAQTDQGKTPDSFSHERGK